MLSRSLDQRRSFKIFGRRTFSFLQKFGPTTLLIPYYHVVSDEDIIHVKHLYEYKTIKEFREDLDYLLCNYSAIGLLELLEQLKSGSPFTRKVFLLTFDDGFREMHDIVAPILFEKGVNATFFVNSAFMDNAQLAHSNKASLLVENLRKSWSPNLEKALCGLLGWCDVASSDAESGILAVRYEQKWALDEVAALMGVSFEAYLSSQQPYLSLAQIRGLIGNGFTVGAHSVDHPLYSSLSLSDQLSQTIESVKAIKQTFNLNYGVFAFPHSDDGVSMEFFSNLSATRLIDLSFGTAGLVEDCVPNNLQRISLEKPCAPAEKLLTYHHTRRLIKKALGDDRIRRK